MSMQQARWGALRGRWPRPIVWVARSLTAGVAAIALTAAALGGYWGVLQYEGNLHAVSAGILYRSAQPSGDELAAAVQQYGIKSVLNLRGANVGSAWYDDELARSRALGLVH